MKERPCRIDGVDYGSEKAAAKALGILAGTLRWRLISSGFPNYVSKHHPRRTVKTTRFTCSIDGIEYRSIASASKKLNLSPNAIKRRLASFDYPQYVCPYIAKKASKAKHRKNQKPCTIGKIYYESECAASRALGISVMLLLTRLVSSNFPEYTSKYHPKIQRRKHRIRCVIKGIEYISISDASRKLKIKPTTIFNRLQSVNYPDYVCTDIPKKPLKPPMYGYKVNGRKYATLQEIADAEGVSRERIRQKMNNPAYREYRRFKGTPSRKH